MTGLRGYGIYIYIYIYTHISSGILLGLRKKKCCHLQQTDGPREHYADELNQRKINTI